MNITKVHLIRLEDLNVATGAPLGAHVRVELGDAAHLSYEQEHRIRSLTYGGKSVQLVGANPRVLDSLESFIAELYSYAFNEELS